MSLKKRKFYFYVLLVVFLVIIPVIMFYTSGYRIGKGFKIVETGGIYINSPEAGSIIYINNKKKKETSILKKDLFVQNLKPDTYNILIAKDGFWPWAKEVTVKEKMVSEAIAFLIPKELKKETIPQMIIQKDIARNTATATEPSKINPEYKKIINLFKKVKDTDNTTPDVDSNNVAPPVLTKTDDSKIALPVIIKSKRGRVELWKEENTVFAKWLKNEKSLPNYFCRNDKCENTVLVFESIADIKNFDFYPGREDVVLLSINNGIYAIEIDVRKHQNFQPVYIGTDPYFIIDNGKFYIKDIENLMKINL